MKTTSRILSAAAVGALALGATAPAAMAHDAHHAHRGHAKPFAGARPAVVREGVGEATLTLKLRKPATKDITYTWSTLDRTPPTPPTSSTPQRRGARESHQGFQGYKKAYKSYRHWGFATVGEDYTASSGSVTIKAGERTTTVTVPILDDTTDERREVFLVRFKPSADATTPAPSSPFGAHGTKLHKGFYPKPVLAPVTIIDND